MAEPPIQAEGQSIGPYKVIGMIGEGGMAVVYKAIDPRLSRYVAIKMIRQTALQEITILHRFEREAKTLAQLNHPNIVKILDYGDYQGLPYLVMEFISGGTYRQQFAGPMDYRSAARALLPIAKALDYAHRKGVIHRDIKPANILIDENGEPKLSDFGIAKELARVQGTELTSTGMIIGTPDYMAPEQITGARVDQRSDIYALGVVFFEMITGQRPFQADTPAGVIIRQAREPLPRPSSLVSGLAPGVDQVLMKAMAKQPDLRYQTMGEFISDLEKLASGASQDFQSFTIQSQGRVGTQTITPHSIAQAGSRAKPGINPALLITGLAIPFVLVGIVATLLILWRLSQDLGITGASVTPATNTQLALATNRVAATLTLAPTETALIQFTFTPTSPTATPTTTLLPASPTISDPGLIFRDDFSDSGSGWTTFQDSSGKAFYEEGQFRIVVNETQLDLWSNPQLIGLQDVRVSVDAQQVSNIDNNIYGVICRYTRSINGYNFYFFGISGMGNAAIGKTINNSQQYLARTSQPSPAINIGQAINKITAICSGETLTLLVNGAELLSVIDRSLTSGDVGLLAGSFSVPGTDILFDNFVVNQP